MTVEPDCLIVTDSNIVFKFYRKRGLAALRLMKEGFYALKKRKKEMDSWTPLGWRKKTCESPDGISGILPLDP